MTTPAQYTAHTPGLRVALGDYETWMVDSAGCEIIRGPRYLLTPELAQRIAVAYNSYPDLLHACKMALQQLEGSKPLSGVHASSLKADIQIVKAAIARAEQSSPREGKE